MGTEFHNPYNRAMTLRTLAKLTLGRKVIRDLLEQSE